MKYLIIFKFKFYYKFRKLIDFFKINSHRILNSFYNIYNYNKLRNIITLHF